MDIWVLSEPENARKIVQVLKAFGVPDAEQLQSIFLLNKRVLGMGIPPYKIEVITSIDGVQFSECYANRLSTVINDIAIEYISLSDLRKNKAASGRYKDLNDLEHLLEEE